MVYVSKLIETHGISVFIWEDCWEENRFCFFALYGIISFFYYGNFIVYFLYGEELIEIRDPFLDCCIRAKNLFSLYFARGESTLLFERFGFIFYYKKKGFKKLINKFLNF